MNSKLPIIASFLFLLSASINSFNHYWQDKNERIYIEKTSIQVQEDYLLTQINDKKINTAKLIEKERERQ